MPDMDMDGWDSPGVRANRNRVRYRSETHHLILAVPRSPEGMTILHYRPLRPGGNPFALAIWLGVWTSGGNLRRGYRIVGGRLWVLERLTRIGHA